MQTAIPLIIVGGAGRMGRSILGLAQADSSFEVVALVDRKEYCADLLHIVPNVYDNVEEAFKLHANTNAVAIDFTSPENTMASAKIATTYNIAYVIGTTGLDDNNKETLSEYAKTNKVFMSPNMSVGINVLLKILPDLVKMLGDNYDIDMVELHHNKKKDSPSGTALRLAEKLAEAKNWKLSEVANYHREGIIGERPKEEIGLQTIRGGDIVGVHTMYFMGPGERIELTHQAHSRENFAQGALRAAKWIGSQPVGKLYSMEDML